MHHSVRHEEDVSGFERHWRLAVDIIFNRAFEDVDDLLARMSVSWEGRSGREGYTELPYLATRDAEIVAL